MRRTLLPLAMLALALPLVAHADTDSTFTFTNVTTTGGTNGGLLTGTVTIDVTTGLYAGIDAQYTTSDGTYLFTDPNPSGTGPFAGGTLDFFTSTLGDASQPGGAQIGLVLPPASLVDYAGGDICSFQNLCNSTESDIFTSANTNGDQILTGSLDVPGTSPVPEPSSLMLLGTGLLGAVGAARRQFNA